MSVLGQGDSAYRLVETWPAAASGLDLSDVAGIAVDAGDEVYVFNRGHVQMVIFDAAGNYLREWPVGIFDRPHGIHIGPDGMVYCTDEGDHTVRRCSPKGEILLEIGVPGEPAPFMSGQPFRRCTHTALSPTGDIYVTDGYGNPSVHKFTPDGDWIMTWGRAGTGPGEFNLPHNLVTDDDGFIYVADRENHRIQKFTDDGEYVTEWRNLHRPAALLFTRLRPRQCVVAEIAPTYPFQLGAPNLGPRLSVLDETGQVVTRLDADPPEPAGKGPFFAPHGLGIDSSGAIYVAEVAATAWPLIFPDLPRPARLHGIRKLIPAGRSLPGRGSQPWRG